MRRPHMKLGHRHDTCPFSELRMAAHPVITGRSYPTTLNDLPCARTSNRSLSLTVDVAAGKSQVTMEMMVPDGTKDLSSLRTAIPSSPCTDSAAAGTSRQTPI